MFSINAAAIAAISRELDGCVLRHEVYSTNIANADVPGYERLDVISSPSSGALVTDRPLNSDSLVFNTHSSVKLAEEMARLDANALRYETLLTAYQQTSGILKMAIREGKGG